MRMQTSSVRVFHFDDMTSVTRSVCKLHEEVRRAFFGEALRGSQSISFRPRDD